MAKKRKLSSDHPPVEETQDAPTKRAPPPPPESGLATLSKSIRGVIGRVTGSGNDFEVSPVVNGASPAPRHFLSKLLSDVKSQGGRFTENFGLLASLTETKLFAGGLADDRKYQVSATRALPHAVFRSKRARPNVSETLNRRCKSDVLTARANLATGWIAATELRNLERP